MLTILFLSACAGEHMEPAVPSLSPDTLAVWMDEGRPVLLLDTRPREAYEARRLPGAVPAGGHSITALREVLPQDPRVPLVVYDEDGSIPREDQPDLALEAVEEYHFPKVYRLQGGLKAWESRGYDLDGNAVVPREP